MSGKEPRETKAETVRAEIAAILEKNNLAGLIVIMEPTDTGKARFGRVNLGPGAAFDAINSVRTTLMQQVLQASEAAGTS